MNKASLAAVQTLIGYSFNDDKYLAAALTHSSYVNEHTAVGNERIEFLGDCVLNFLVGERLFLLDRTASEGALSARRSALVSRAPLSRIVDELGLLEFLQVGAGVDKRAFSDKARSDIFEAILGAVYIDGGIDACKTVLEKIFYDRVTPERDYKSTLQELATAEGLTVSYATREVGGGFDATVTVGADAFSAHGRSKRAAQIAAAKSAVDTLIIK